MPRTKAEGVVVDHPAGEQMAELPEAEGARTEQEVARTGDDADRVAVAEAEASRNGRVAADVRRRAERLHWGPLEEAERRCEMIRVRVLGIEGPDLVANVPGRVKGVIPAPEIGELPGGDRGVTNLLGQEVPVYVERLDRAAGVAVLSRRKAREELARKTRETLRVGDRRRAVVRAAYSKGLVVDIDGVYAYVPGGEIAWHRVELPGEEFPVGSEIEVEVVDIQDVPGEGRFSLAYRPPVAHSITYFPAFFFGQ